MLALRNYSKRKRPQKVAKGRKARHHFVHLCLGLKERWDEAGVACLGLSARIQFAQQRDKATLLVFFSNQKKTSTLTNQTASMSLFRGTSVPTLEAETFETLYEEILFTPAYTLKCLSGHELNKRLH